MVMRKTTVLHYNEADVRKIVHDELVKTKPAWTSEITEKVTEKITQFKDDVIAMLDKVMGELKAIREEQTLMSASTLRHPRNDLVF
jgi:hypothetical protein